MALQVEQLTLDDADLSGGARIASADGTLPRRITTALDRLSGIIGVVRGGVAVWNDNAHVVVPVRSSNVLRRYDTATWSLQATYSGNGATRSISTPETLTRSASDPNIAWFACGVSNGFFGAINLTTGAVELYAQTGLTPYMVVQIEAGKVWARSGATTSGTWTEYDLSGTGDSATATATGRTLGSGVDMVAIGTTYALWTDGSNLRLYSLASGTEVATLATLNSLAMQQPGQGNTWRTLVLDSAGGIWLWEHTTKSWSKVTVDTGTPSISITDAMPVPNTFLGGLGEPSASTNFVRRPWDFTSDGQKMYSLFPSSATSYMSDLQVVKEYVIGPQDAVWEWTPGANVTVKQFAIGGDFANQKGAVTPLTGGATQWETKEWSFRHTRFYWSIDGGAETLFRPGTPLDIEVADDETFAVRAEFIRSPFSVQFGPHPWIGGDGGEGPEIYYDDGITPSGHKTRMVGAF